MHNILVRKPSKKTNALADRTIQVIVDSFDFYKSLTNDQVIDYAKTSKHYNSMVKLDGFSIYLEVQQSSISRLIKL